jgi:hypothetical protein
MTGFEQLNLRLQRRDVVCRQMPFFDDNHATGQAFTDDLSSGDCHRRPCLAGADDPDSIKCAEIVCNVSGNQRFSLTTQKAADRSARLDGGDCCCQDARHCRAMRQFAQCRGQQTFRVHAAAASDSKRSISRRMTSRLARQNAGERRSIPMRAASSGGLASPVEASRSS